MSTSMSSYVHICPGCGYRYRDPQTFLWHTESCDSSESLSWVDRQGDVWRVGEDGLMHTPETAPFPRE